MTKLSQDLRVKISRRRTPAGQQPTRTMPGWEAPAKSTSDRKQADKLFPVTRWPEAYGFTVTSGDGPCFVTSVERGSAAHKSGICPGDHFRSAQACAHGHWPVATMPGICPGDQIVEVDGRNVADMSADRVRVLSTLSVNGQRSGFKVTAFDLSPFVVNCRRSEFKILAQRSLLSSMSVGGQRPELKAYLDALDRGRSEVRVQGQRSPPRDSNYDPQSADAGRGFAGPVHRTLGRPESRLRDENGGRQTHRRHPR